MSVDHSVKQYIDIRCLPLLEILENSGNLMWCGKWSPCIYSVSKLALL